MKLFPVSITRTSDGTTIRTHAWGEDERAAAKNVVAEFVDHPEIWDGWEASIFVPVAGSE